MNNNRHCPKCYWRVSLEDIFCGSCRYPLARLVVSPDRNKDLTIYSGIPFTLKLKNEGINPIKISGLAAFNFEITQWQGGEPPYTLDADDEVELRCSHDAREGGIGRLELLSSSEPNGSVDIWVRCQKAPEISLEPADGDALRHDAEEPQSCAMDPNDGRIFFTLRHDSPLTLQGTPYLSEGESHFVLHQLPEAFPHRLSPGDPLRFYLIRRQEFSEETCGAVLNFPFDGLGEVAFKLAVRYVERPKIDWQFSHRFVNENALVSGGKENIDFALTVEHSGGPPLRINRVESDQKWLEGKITDQNYVPIDSSSTEIGLLLNRDSLPTVEQDTTIEAMLDIHGTTVGKDEPFHEPIPFRVQIRPPQRLDFPIAVDFGSTNSCIAYLDPQDGNRENLLELGTGEGVSELPSVFQFLAIAEIEDFLEVLQALGTDERRAVLKEKEVFLRFGDTLKELRFSSEDIPSICWGFKRWLTTPDEKIIYNDLGTGSIGINGRAYTRGNRYIEVNAIEMVGLYLRFLLERFQEITGYLPSEAIFTYPAVFNHHKEALEKAIEWAMKGMELKVILDISEPEAIALDYAMDLAETLERGQTIVYGVFDCGGGTTDISIVRLTSQGGGRPDVEILGSDGDNSLGGDLLSFRIARYLYDQIVPPDDRQRFPFPGTLGEALRIKDENFSTLYGLAETIKEKDEITPEFEDALEVITRKFLSDEEDMARKKINIEAIHDAVREDLEKGFDKLGQMQEYLVEKKQIDDVQLDYLILEGNSSRFPLIKQMAKEKVHAKEIIFEPERLKKSVALGGIKYGASLMGGSTGSRITGIHKLNYPICRSAYTHFVPIFDRWTPLKPGTTIKPENPSPIIPTERALGEIRLLEFFGWDFNTRMTQGKNRVAAALRVPIEDDAFQRARFWTYCLELRCDAKGKASLWYNYRVGDEEDGSDFELVWEEHRHCEGFSYT